MPHSQLPSLTDTIVSVGRSNSVKASSLVHGDSAQSYQSQFAQTLRKQSEHTQTRPYRVTNQQEAEASRRIAQAQSGKTTPHQPQTGKVQAPERSSDSPANAQAQTDPVEDVAKQGTPPTELSIANLLSGLKLNDEEDEHDWSLIGADFGANLGAELNAANIISEGAIPQELASYTFSLNEGEGLEPALSGKGSMGISLSAGEDNVLGLNQKTVTLMDAMQGRQVASGIHLESLSLAEQGGQPNTNEALFTYWVLGKSGPVTGTGDSRKDGELLTVEGLVAQKADKLNNPGAVLTDAAKLPKNEAFVENLKSLMPRADSLSGSSQPLVEAPVKRHLMQTGYSQNFNADQLKDFVGTLSGLSDRTKGGEFGPVQTPDISNLVGRLQSGGESTVATSSAQVASLNGSDLFSVTPGQTSTEVNALHQLKSTAEFSQPLLARDATFAQNIAVKISWMMGQAIKSAEIALDPPELGHLNVRIHHQNGETSVLFQTNNPQAKDLLNDQLPRLKEMLQQQGLQLADSNVQDQSAQSSAKEETANHSHLADKSFHDEHTEDEVQRMTTRAFVSPNRLDHFA